MIDLLSALFNLWGGVFMFGAAATPERETWRRLYADKGGIMSARHEMIDKPGHATAK